MTIQGFIDSAMKGGWKNKWRAPLSLRYRHRILLDPLAWYAVFNERAEDKMLAMVRALCGGKSLEQYLETL